MDVTDTYNGTWDWPLKPQTGGTRCFGNHHFPIVTCR